MNTSNAFITARAFEVIEAAPGERLLEIGPGNGRLSAATVASLGEAGGYLGLEYNEDIAAVARESLAGCDSAVEVRSGNFMSHAPEHGGFDGLLAVKSCTSSTTSTRSQGDATSGLGATAERSSDCGHCLRWQGYPSLTTAFTSGP